MSHADDICPRPERTGPQPTRPLAPPIQPTSVWICDDPGQVERLNDGAESGYIYQREAHPNADLLAVKCRELHEAEQVAVTSCGMSALSLALLSQLEPGDHVVLSHMLYGCSVLLFTREANRLGITSSVADLSKPENAAAALTASTRLVLTETIANPRLIVSDIAALAEIAHQRSARLLIDNTFATPVLCRPLNLGADLVMESVSKMMNGHSDVMLGLLCGRQAHWERVNQAMITWGLTSSPFDCWLALRGLATMHLRVDRACGNALRAAEYLAGRPEIEHVDYPGLSTHAQHDLARKQLGGRFGSMIAFRLVGGRPAADAFIAAARRIPFCPSLGEVSTTLSHPETTSHRAMTPAARDALGIGGGTIRLSVGVESPEFVVDALAEGLRAVRAKS